MLIPTLCVLAALAEPPAPAADSLEVHVRIEGIRGEMRASALAHMRLAREARAGRALSESEVHRLHARSPDQIRLALRPFGYYRPEVESELRPERGAWRATYRVRVGEPVRVTRIDVRLAGEGVGDPALERAVAAFPLRPGDPFRDGAYEQAKRGLQGAARERGYLDAAFRERRVLVDPDAGTAEVILELESGPRSRFGPVRFVGSDLEEAFLQSFVGFRPGDPVTTAEMLELQNALQASQLFAAVEVELLRREGEGLQVPVEVRLAPRPRRRYDTGVGVGTDTGPRVILGAELRQLNRSGHSLVGEVRGSLVRSGLDATYLIPLPGAPGNRLGISAGFLDERAQDTRSTKATLGLGWHRNRGTWREVWLVDVQRELSGEGDELQRSTMVLPSVRWTRTQLDDPVYPGRGHRARLEAVGTHRSLASDVSFVQVVGRVGAVASPWERGRVLLRADAGSTLTRSVTDLPVSLRFYAGGDRSVRGYAYRALSPESPEGLVLGGRHLLVVSGELEQLVWRSWGAAVFVDAGNAGNAWPPGPRTGAGAGLRWRSPVGMVRVDLAAALSESGPPWRVHLSVGPGL